MSKSEKNYWKLKVSKPLCPLLVKLVHFHTAAHHGVTRNACLTLTHSQAEREELELQRSVRSFKGVGNDEDAYNMGYSAKKVAPGSDEERYRRSAFGPH